MESLGLLFKVFWAPGEAMGKVSTSVRAALAPILLLTVVGVISAAVAVTHLNMGEITLRLLERSPQFQQMTAEQKQQVVARSNSPSTRVMSYVGAVVTPTLSITLLTVIFFGIFTLVGRNGGFKTFFTITAFAMVPLVIRYIAGILTVLYVPSSSIMLDEIGSISPSIFVDRTAVSKTVFSLLNQMDVITIWVLALLVIGYRFVVTKRVSAPVRIACVFGIWLAWVGFRVALSSLLPF
jgi:Yip1 domain